MSNSLPLRTGWTGARSEEMTRGVGLRGYNGNLSLATETVTIGRGIKGFIVRHRWSSTLRIPVDAIQSVWFQPAARGWLVGYVRVLTTTESPDECDFVSAYETR
jgi:hypothetical protein